MALSLISKPKPAKPHGIASHPVMQAKLKVGEPNDRFEQEADRVAADVMRMPAHATNAVRTSVSGVSHGLHVQRLCTECEEDVQRSPKAQATTKTGKPPSGPSISALTQGGEPLSASVRAFFEPRFGHDFSRVRVHPNAGAAVDALNARAFTVGHNVAFGPGEYAPDNRSGKWLLAHELAHVVQQERGLSHNGLIQRSPKTPTYQDCTVSTTLSRSPNRELESARLRALDFVNGAISVLVHDPAKFPRYPAYGVALGRHFLSPDAADREKIRDNFIKIRDQLKPAKIRCVATEADTAFCDSSFETAVTAAFERHGEAFLCMGFWLTNHKCKAMTLIHEAAHAIGIGMGSPHPPYRGSTEYPFGAGAAGSGESTSARMDNPDAYSHFAAHVWREVDTECHAHVFRSETIEITGEAPDVGMMRLFEEADGCAEQEDLSPFCASVIREAVSKGWGKKE